MNKEAIKERYKVLENNPTREERLDSLMDGKVIKVTHHSITYYKLDKYQRLCFSYTGHPNSFQPFATGFNYSDVLDDYDSSCECKKSIEIIEGGLKNESKIR